MRVAGVTATLMAAPVAALTSSILPSKDLTVLATGGEAGPGTPCARTGAVRRRLASDAVRKRRMEIPGSNGGGTLGPNPAWGKWPVLTPVCAVLVSHRHHDQG